MDIKNSSSKKVIAIAAMSLGRIIGKDDKIPWHIPGEQKHFAKLTKGHTVLMGRETFDSLPDKAKPLPKRVNIVASRTLSSLNDFPKVMVINNINKYVNDFKSQKSDAKSNILWIIGGQQIYEVTKDLWDEVYLTSINGKYEGNVYFPEFEKDFELYKEEVLPTHKYQYFKRR